MVKNLLISTLEEFGYPVILQGSLSTDRQYPENFFTFWNNDTFDGKHYDDNAVSYVWSFDVNFYSTDVEKVNSILLAAKTKLKAKGFVVPGKGYDVGSDEPTHTGRGINALYLEIERTEE